MKKCLSVALTLLLSGAVAFASKEGPLLFSSFSIASPGVGSSGPVTVTGKTDAADHLIALTVIAFGKTFQLNKDQLMQLVGLKFNGIQLSYEAGYAQLGGRTVYIAFQGGLVASSHTSSLVILEVTETRGVKVR